MNSQSCRFNLNQSCHGFGELLLIELRGAYILAALLAALSTKLALAAVTYQITDLGTLGGATSSAFDVNIHGDVVGSSTLANGETRAFLFHNGNMTDLGVLEAKHNFSQAFGINDAGLVVGVSARPDPNGHLRHSRPFVYSSGKMMLVGSLGGDYGLANDINTAGHIVGISADGNGVTHAFLKADGSMIDLGSFRPTNDINDYSIAYGVSDTGSVTGYSTTRPKFSEAFLYRDGRLLNLGNLGGFSRGFEVNNSHQVTGASIIDENGHEHAFLWENGRLKDLGTTAGAATSQGLDINNSGHIVGTLVFDPNHGELNHGFFYRDGRMIDVNTLLPKNSKWVLRDAQAINDLGQIVGVGNINGHEHAYLLTPVPKVSDVAIRNNKLAVPAEDSLKTAVDNVQAIYGDSFKNAQTVEQKTSLAKKLFEVGNDTTDDVAGRYVLFRMARDLAAENGDIRTSFLALSQLEQEFEIGSQSERLNTFESLVKSVRQRDDIRILIRQLNECVHGAIRVNEYKSARQFAEFALVAAQKIRDVEMLKESKAQLDDLAVLEKEYVAVQAATAILEKTPADPTANSIVGKYICFVKGEWNTGIPMLIVGNDEALRAVAEQDLADPKDANEQVKLADAWWNLASSEKGLKKRNIIAHSQQWYAAAFPRLTGLTRARVEQRSKEWQRATAPPMSQAVPDFVSLDALLSSLSKGMNLQGVPLRRWTDLQVEMAHTWMKEHADGLSMRFTGKFEQIYTNEEKPIVRLWVGPSKDQSPVKYRGCSTFAYFDIAASQDIAKLKKDDIVTVRGTISSFSLRDHTDVKGAVVDVKLANSVFEKR
jgi:probable HAF family extracellular repeat protein